MVIIIMLIIIEKNVVAKYESLKKSVIKIMLSSTCFLFVLLLRLFQYHYFDRNNFKRIIELMTPSPVTFHYTAMLDYARKICMIEFALMLDHIVLTYSVSQVAIQSVKIVSIQCTNVITVYAPPILN